MAYELTAVARVPQSGAAPTLTEIGPIVAPTITRTRSLKGAGGIAFSCTPDRLDDGIKNRLLDLAAFPTEVWLYRNGTLIDAAFIAGYQIQSGTLTISATGLLGYLAYMYVDADLTYTGQDQTSVIGKGLVDQWQALPYGNYGIVTTGIAASGVTRDRKYIAAEHHQVSQRLRELGAAANGFDVDLNPATRALLLSYPQKGTDLSASVVLDGRNITDSGIVVSVAPGDLASEGIGLAGSAATAPLTSAKSNTTLRASFGRSAVAGSFDGVTQQATLDQHTQSLIDARAKQMFLPGPGLIPVADVDVGSFDIGDTVTYSYDAGLGLQSGAFRVVEIQTSVDESGAESMAVRFA